MNRSATLALWTIVAILLIAGAVAYYELQVKPENERQALIERCVEGPPSTEGDKDLEAERRYICEQDYPKQ